MYLHSIMLCHCFNAVSHRIYPTSTQCATNLVLIMVHRPALPHKSQPIASSPLWRSFSAAFIHQRPAVLPIQSCSTRSVWTLLLPCPTALAVSLPCVMELATGLIQWRRQRQQQLLLLLRMLSVLILQLVSPCASQTSIVQVEVDAATVLANTDTTFLCATLDWYPADRCSYGICSWDHASILNLDLSNSLLEKSLRALSPLRIRLGGTVQDQIVYETGTLAQPCLPLVKDNVLISGYRGGCLSMDRWVALNQLFAKTGTRVAFGLNALFNRPKVGNVWGPWDSSNARDFIKFTVEQGIQVEAWELGNELTANRVITSIPAEQYAADVKELRSIIDTLYSGNTRRPLLVAPDGTGNVAGAEYSWYTTFLKASGTGVVDAITRHIYNLGPGDSPDLVERILNPAVLDNDIGNYRVVQNIIRTTAPWASAWVGEAGGAYNSGRPLVSNAFIMSFWYLDQLAMAASFNTKAYCRQSLIGGNYGLLNSTTFLPNPDLYSAILWKRLMGQRVFATRVEGYPSLRAYTHCQGGTTSGGVTILLINLSNLAVNVELQLKSPPTPGLMSRERKSPKSRLIPHKSKVASMRLEYHLSAPNNDLHSQTVLLNETPLVLTPLGDLPSLDPISRGNSSPVLVNPLSIVFISLPDAQVPLCY